MKYLFVTGLLSFMLFACQNETASTKNAAWSDDYDAVMKVHDEVMPKLKDITKSLSKLKKISPSDLSDENKELHGLTNDLLNQAETGMWDWMHAFKKKKELLKMSDAEVTSYLDDQKSKVNKVKFDIVNSLEAYELFKTKVEGTE